MYVNLVYILLICISIIIYLLYIYNEKSNIKDKICKEIKVKRVKSKEKLKEDNIIKKKIFRMVLNNKGNGKDFYYIRVERSNGYIKLTYDKNKASLFELNKIKHKSSNLFNIVLVKYSSEGEYLSKENEDSYKNTMVINYTTFPCNEYDILFKKTETNNCVCLLELSKSKKVYNEYNIKFFNKHYLSVDKNGIFHSNINKHCKCNIKFEFI
jgi:hypothetical protein